MGTGPAQDLNFAVFRRQFHVPVCRHGIIILVITNADISFLRQDIHTAAIRLNRLHNMNVALMHQNANVAAGRDIAAPVTFSVNHSDRNFTVAHSHLYIITRNNIPAYGNIAHIRLHRYIMLNPDVLIQHDIAAFTGLSIEIVACGHIVRYMQVSVFYNQVRIPARRQFAILIKNNALAISVVGLVDCRYIDITAFRGGFAKNPDLTAPGRQVHILSGRHSICVFVVANRNAAMFCQHIHASVLRLHGLFYRNITAVHGHLHIVFRNDASRSVTAHRNIACSHSHVHIVACGHIFINRNRSRLYVHVYITARSYISAYMDVSLNSGAHANRTVFGRNRLADIDIAGFCLHGHIFHCRDIFIQHNIALFARPDIEAALSDDIVRHMQVAVFYNQVCVTACCNQSMLVKFNVLAVLAIGSIYNRYIHVAGFRSRLAVNLDHAVLGRQVHIIPGSNRFYRRSVVSDLNVAVFCQDVHVSGFGFYGLFYGNVTACHGHLYIIGCHHVAFSVFAYQDVARFNVHIYILAGDYISAHSNITLNGGRHVNRTVLGRNGLTNVNIAGFRLHRHIFIHGNVIIQRNIAAPARFRIQVASCSHMIRHMKVAVGHNQGRVTARCQFPILVKDNVLAVFTFHIVVVGGMYGNIARLRGGLARDPDLSAFRRQVHIPSGRHRLHVRTVVADLDIAVLYQYIHITASGLHGLIHGNTAAGNGQRHMIARNHVTLSVAAAYPDVARPCGHGYIPACVDILAYIDAAVLRLHRGVLAHGDVFIYIDTAFFTGFRIIAAPCGNLVCHMDVAVHHDHGSIPTGLHLTVMVYDDVLAGFARYVSIISGQ